jgi:molybdopterin synthase catalytic subunit
MPAPDPNLAVYERRYAHAMIELTHEPIDCERVLQLVRSNDAGAVVLFLGTTRGVTHGRSTHSLDYECYPEMARGKLSQLEEQAHNRWPILRTVIVHRLGHLEVGEISVAVAVSTAHRADAFQAGQWLIDTIKLEIPIWKKENWSDGTCEWVHPCGATE